MTTTTGGTATETRPLLEAEDLTVDLLSSAPGTPRSRRVVRGVSFAPREGETLALIGESGSGKSLSAMALMGLLPATTAEVGGSVRHRGTDLLTLHPDALRARRGKHLAMIFQDALSALNPTLTVGFQIAEVIRAHEKVSRREARARAVELMARVRIPDPARRYRDYPHQFSGGQRQRVMIASALALAPEILIADEPTTALDVTVQAQIMELLAELREETGSALLLITHDLGLAAAAADRVAIMYAGHIVEQAPVEELYDRPAHPYTGGLLAALPRLDGPPGDLTSVPGTPPAPGPLPDGCAFRPRCATARASCAARRPVLLPAPSARLVARHYPLEASSAR
ncbi:ABC transporter ATP-binding protein [Streptomyces coelicoflavus]|uniref:ABC transporter ATP-binding protein n=1 Tax=Streptomyces coelicoflavus TaxID=285562 RepID=UPI003668431B